MKLKVFTEECRLWLPVRPARREDAGIAFASAEAAAPVTVQQLSVANHNWHVVYDLAEDRHTLQVTDDNGIEHVADAAIDYEAKNEEWYSSVADDFESILAEVRSVRGLKRGDWKPRIYTRTRLTSTREHFHLIAELDAYEGDQRVFSRNWDRQIPRRGV